jgi:hypothetical protein
MTKLELMRMANEGYPDGMLSEYYDDHGNYVANDGAGDGLAALVVAELSETFDENAKDETQVDEAVRVLKRAQRDLEDTVNALQRFKPCRR